MIFKWGYAVSTKTWVTIPDWAANLPERAATMEQVRLPFYCCNCQRKRSTRYITPNFGPFCADCLDDCLSELLLLMKEGT